jgi:hypothetical protein
MQSIVSTSIYIRQGKAYVATVGDCEIANIVTEPIYIVNLSLDYLTEAIEKIFRAGTPNLPRPPGDKLYNLPKPDPLLKAAKVSSWKKLAQGGTVYGIDWYSHEIVLTFYKNDEKGRFVPDMPKELHFPVGTDISRIVHTILNDVHSRPELSNRIKY